MHGALKGNMGILKSLMAELTDESNVAQGFSMLPVATAVAYMIGFGSSLVATFILLILFIWCVALLSAVFYPDRRIAGQIYSPTLSGPNIPTFFRA